MTLSGILLKATKEAWATGHFNASESDQFRAITEAAKEVGTAAIIGTSEGEAEHLGRLEATALRDALRREFGIPVFLNADHHKSVEAAKEAIDAGYDSIHIDLSHLAFKENVWGTKELVAYARQAPNSKLQALNIEGELGYLAGESKIQDEKIEVDPEDYTDPQQAKIFVEETGVNRLAIAVGNIHGISKEEPELDINRIREIRRMVPPEVALVLHAGSGIPGRQIKAAIEAGVANIHINTDIRVAYTNALRNTMAERPEETTPYKYDAIARDILKNVIKMKLEQFGAKL